MEAINFSLNEENELNIYKKLRLENYPNMSLRSFSNYIHEKYPNNWIAAPHISEIENGKRVPTLRELLCYSMVFDVSVDYLLYIDRDADDTTTLVYKIIQSLSNEPELIKTLYLLFKNDSGYALLEKLNEYMNDEKVDFNSFFAKIKQNPETTYNDYFR